MSKQAQQPDNQYCKECQKVTWHTPKFDLSFENKRLCSVCRTSNKVELTLQDILHKEKEWSQMFDSDVRVAMALLTYIRENK